MKHVLICPHGDDEIIGCYEILERHKGDCVVLFPSSLACKQAQKSSKLFNFKIGTTDDITMYGKENTEYYFPDHTYELHPEHRRWGGVGEILARQGYNVSFYVTNMLAPYTHEVKEASKKHRALNECYPTKQSLWHSDHKYFLFEGQCKWIFPNE